MQELSEKASLELSQQIDADLTAGGVVDGDDTFYIVDGQTVRGYFDNGEFYIELINDRKLPPFTHFEG